MFSSTPKKGKVILSTGKVMVSVFGDPQVIVFIDYLQKGQTMNYANLQRQLHENQTFRKTDERPCFIRTQVCSVQMRL